MILHAFRSDDEGLLVCLFDEGQGLLVRVKFVGPEISILLGTDDEIHLQTGARELHGNVSFTGTGKPIFLAAASRANLERSRRPSPLSQRRMVRRSKAVCSSRCRRSRVVRIDPRALLTLRAVDLSAMLSNCLLRTAGCVKSLSRRPWWWVRQWHLQGRWHPKLGRVDGPVYGLLQLVHDGPDGVPDLVKPAELLPVLDVVGHSTIPVDGLSVLLFRTGDHTPQYATGSCRRHGPVTASEECRPSCCARSGTVDRDAPGRV